MIESDTECITPHIFPIEVIKHAWNQSIIPQAFIEPALLHVLLGVASNAIASLHGQTPAECNAVMQSHKVTSIGLINRKLESVVDATQLSTVFTIVMLLGIEVSAHFLTSLGLLYHAHRMR